MVADSAPHFLHGGIASVGPVEVGILQMDLRWLDDAVLDLICGRAAGS
jgi:hypothetical protein